MLKFQNLFEKDIRHIFLSCVFILSVHAATLKLPQFKDEYKILLKIKFINILLNNLCLKNSISYETVINSLPYQGFLFSLCLHDPKHKQQEILNGPYFYYFQLILFVSDKKQK